MTMEMTWNEPTVHVFSPPNPKCCDGDRVTDWCEKCQSLLQQQTRISGRSAATENERKDVLPRQTINYKADLEARLAGVRNQAATEPAQVQPRSDLLRSPTINYRADYEARLAAVRQH
jgi:hypothetical protein